MRRRFSSASLLSSSINSPRAASPVALAHGRGIMRNRPRIAAAPYQPASAAVPRISHQHDPLEGHQQAEVREPVESTWRNIVSLRFPTRSSSLFISVSDFCISDQCVAVPASDRCTASVPAGSSGFPPAPSLFRLPAPSACLIACGKSHWITMGWIICGCGAAGGALLG